MIGTRIGPWLVTEEIGDGGHAFVFKGIRGDQSVAIKMLKPSVAGEDNLEKRFRIEAETLKTLSHPGIVGFRDYFCIKGRHFLVMEMMDAGSVEDILRKVGPIEPRYALPMVFPVVQGIIHAHASGYIHRDIKPNNVLLNKEGQAKVTDFGIAKVLGAEALTRPGFVLGTALYMAPEYLSQGVVSPASDVYALGVTLYEMLTNRKPFEYDEDGEQLVAFVKRLVTTDPTPPTAYRPVPHALERIVMKALARDTKKRYRTVERLGNDLKKAFPELVERPIEIPEGRPRTRLVQLPLGAEERHAAGRTPGPRMPARPELLVPLVTALLAGTVAGLLAKAVFDMAAPVAAIAGAAVALLGIAGTMILRERKPAAAMAGGGQALPAAVPAEAEELPPEGEPEEPDAVPFHGGTPPRVAQETDVSELAAFLVVTGGQLKGKRYGLRPVSRIGRDLRFDIRPRDPEISRQHAVLCFDGTGFVAKDLGSRNGTFVNEVRIEEEQELRPGDILRIGRTSMRLDMD